jgi:hypothetical protein
MKEYEFDAVLIKHKDMNAAFIEFPYGVENEFGKKGQVKVQVTFDGVEYRGSLAKMGYPCHILGVTQKIRKKINKNPGDTVHVVLKQDIEPRIVEVPQDFAELLVQNSEAKKLFDSMSYTHRKEYVSWIEGAKREETRKRRLQKSIDMILDKRKTHIIK